MIPRHRIQIYSPALTPNASGGQQVDESVRGTLKLDAVAEVVMLKPSRDQLAQQARLGLTLKVTLWARSGLVIDTDDLLYWQDAPYSLQGPPVVNQLGTEWILYALNSIG